MIPGCYGVCDSRASEPCLSTSICDIKGCDCPTPLLPLLALRLQDHNADSIPRRVTKATWWKVHEGYCAQVGGVEPKVIEEILAGKGCAAT